MTQSTTAASAAPFALGDRVRFRRGDELHRQREPEGGRVWRKSTEPRDPDDPEIVGVVVGARSLPDGRIEVHGGGRWSFLDDPDPRRAEWHAEGSTAAVLVAFHLRRRPVFLLPADLTPQPDRPPLT